jgi:very-short-patch-repair endonuclease
MSHLHEADRLIARIAARQHGVFTKQAARDCGLPESTIEWRARNGRYRSIWPTVYSLPGVPDTWEKLAMAGVLHAGPGAALSGGAAARKLLIPGFEKERIEISTPKRIRDPGFAVHSRTPLRTDEIIKRDSIPVTIPERTLLDLSAVLSEPRLEAAVDSVIHQGLSDFSHIVGYVEQSGLPRRRRSLLVKILSERGDVVANESLLETGLARLLRHPSLPPAVRQYRIYVGGKPVGRPDFAYPEVKLAVEGHSLKFHGSELQRKRDAARHELLESMGWYIVYVTWWEAVYRAAETRERVRRIYYGRLSMVVGRG